MAIVLGLDLGSKSVKTVSLRAGLRAPELVTAACRPRPPGDEAEVLAALERGAARDSIVTAVPGEEASLLFLDFPFAARKLDEAIVLAEVEPQVPGSIDGLQATWQPIRDESGGSRIAAALTDREALEKRLERMAEAGLDPRIVDLDLFALYTCALAWESEADVRAVLDVGARKSLLVVLEGDELRGARVLPYGGDRITARIAEALGIELDEAERLKVDFADARGLRERIDPTEPPQARAVAEALHRGYADILRQAAITLRAIERSCDLDVERLELTGGGARPPGLDATARNALGIPAAVAPLPTLADGTPGALEVAWPDAAVALGLALRGSRGAGGSGLDFRSGDLAYQREGGALARRLAPVALPLVALLLFALLSLGVRYRQLSVEADRVRHAKIKIYKELFPRERSVRLPKNQLEQKIKEQRQLLALLGGSVDPPEILRAMSVAAPADVDVTLDGFDYEPERMTLRGRAVSFEALKRFEKALGAESLFRAVQVTEQTKAGAEVNFRLQIKLEAGRRSSS